MVSLKLTYGSSSSLPALSSQHNATFLYSSRTWFFFYPLQLQHGGQQQIQKLPLWVPKASYRGGEEGGGTRHFVGCQCVSVLSLSGWRSSYGSLIARPLPFSFFFSSLLNLLSGRLRRLVTVPVSASSSEVALRRPALCHILPGRRVAPPYGTQHLKVVKTAGCPACHTVRMQKLIKKNLL